MEKLFFTYLRDPVKVMVDAWNRAKGLLSGSAGLPGLTVGSGIVLSHCGNSARHSASYTMVRYFILKFDFTFVIRVS